MTTTKARGYLSINDAAEATGMAPRTLTRWCEARKVKGAKRQQTGSGRWGYRWLVPASWVAERAA